MQEDNVDVLNWTKANRTGPYDSPVLIQSQGVGEQEFDIWGKISRSFYSLTKIQFY